MPSHRPQFLSRRFRRHPVAYWVATAVLALATILVVTGVVGRAEARSARFGDLVPAAVARTDLAAGTRLTVEDVEVRRLPADLVPDGALTEIPEGAVLADAVRRGEVLPGSRLAPAGASPLVAQLPPGTRALAVPAGPGALPLEPGDAVDVLATLDPSATGGGEPTVTVARDALVVDVGAGAVSLAVTEAQAPRVAYAVTAGAVTLAAVSADPTPPGG